MPVISYSFLMSCQFCQLFQLSEFFYLSVQCGGDLTANSTGEITSPRFPLNYPDEANCEWKICVSQGSRIKLTFSDFEVSDSVHFEQISVQTTRYRRKLTCFNNCMSSLSKGKKLASFVIQCNPVNTTFGCSC